MPRGWTGSAPWNARGTRSPLPPVTTRRRVAVLPGVEHRRAAPPRRDRTPPGRAHPAGGRTEPPPLEETSPPHGGSLRWYETGLGARLDAIRTVDPATPVWTFSRSDPTATFSHRRTTNQTVVHRVDAEKATGTVGPLDPALVLDGIAESLAVFAPLIEGVQLRVQRAGPSLESKVLDVGPARLRHAPAVQPEEHGKRGVEVIEALGSEQEGAKFAAIHAVALAWLHLRRRTYWWGSTGCASR